MEVLALVASDVVAWETESLDVDLFCVSLFRADRVLSFTVDSISWGEASTEE